MSDEDSAKVGAYVDEMGLTVRVGAGSKAGGDFKIKGYPTSAVIDAQGNVAWMGHPSSLSNGTVESALKGAKPRAGGFLSFTPTSPAEGRVEAQIKSIEQGKIAKAHAALVALAGDEKASEAERASATALAGEIDAHVGKLTTQAERFVKSRDVLKAVTVYEALAKEFGAAKAGADAKARLDEMRKDEALSKEIAAAEAFEKTRASASKLASSKARDKWRDFAEKYKGTRAAERAMAMAKPPKD